MFFLATKSVLLLSIIDLCPGDTQKSRPYKQGTPGGHENNNYGPGHVRFTGLVGLYKSERSRETRKINRKTETPRFPNEGRHGHFPTRLASKADQKLFRAIHNNPHHVLYRLHPEFKKTGYNTRARAHNFVLPPTCKDNSNFLPRLLYT